MSKTSLFQAFPFPKKPSGEEDILRRVEKVNEMISSGSLIMDDHARDKSKKISREDEAPNKSHFYVSSAAELVAEKYGLNKKTVTNKIYKRIESGDIISVRVLGTLMLERNEVIKILEGDDL